MMVGKLLLKVLFYNTLIIVGALRLTRALPILDPASMLPDSGYEDSRIMLAKIDQPIQAEMLADAVRDMGGNLVLLFPPTHVLEKRDPPDLGVGRSYTGQRAANILLGQAATNSAVGPGKKRSEKVSLEHGYVM